MGRVFKFGNNVDTDVIIPARYLNSAEESRLALHCMEDISADFHKKVNPGDFVVAGENFGCGSSREHAPLALKACKIGGVIATSFARIFFRNAINIGLCIAECAEVAEIADGDEAEVDFKAGIIYDKTTGKHYEIKPFPDFIEKIVANGGLLESMKYFDEVKK